MSGYYSIVYFRNHTRSIVEADVWQIAIGLAVTLTALLGGINRYVRSAIKAQEARRKVDVENEREERTKEIANKQQKFESDIDIKRKEMEVRILSEQANSEQSLALSSALETMATAFNGLAKSIQQHNENSDEWRNTFITNHQLTINLIESTSEIGGQERQLQIGLLQQILLAVSTNGGVRYGDKAIPHMLEFPPG